MVQSAIAVADRAPAAAVGPPAVTEIRADLLKLFGAVSDGRSGQGRDHPVAAGPALAAGAAGGNEGPLRAGLVGPEARTSVIAAQAEVGVKTNEVPMAKPVLGQVDLHGKMVTADALHTVRAPAELIHKGGGEFALPVKENRKALFDALDALPWREVPVAHTATDRGHGRITTRTIQVLPAPEGLPFPHVSQVYPT